MNANKTEQVKDLLKNDDFVSWVVQPREESDHFWYHWIQSNAERSKDVELARKIILSFKSKNAELMPEQHYKEVLNAIMQTSRMRKAQSVSFFNWNRSFLVAASVCLLIIVGTYFFFQNSATSNEKVAISTIVKEVPIGVKVSTKLPDGSSVMLNSGSSISFPSEFFGGSRKVKLTGEAFFDVKRDVQQPFIIETNELEIEVLGTSFNVRAYIDELNSVAVKTGKVSVRNIQGNESVFINASEMVSLIDEIFEQKQVTNKDVVFGWTDQYLVFQNNTFNEVLVDIERWFGVTISVEHLKTPSDLFTSKFDNPTLQEVMESFAHVYGLKYDIKENVIVLK